jgi:hypothetical protein
LRVSVRPEEQIDQLREAVEMPEQDWTLVKRTCERGLSVICDEYDAHVYLPDAQLRLASAEGEAAAIANLSFHPIWIRCLIRWGLIPHLGAIW